MEAPRVPADPNRTGTAAGDLAGIVDDQDAGATLESMRKALRESEARLAASFENAPIGMALIGLEGDEQGRVLRVNHALCALLRAPAAQLLGSTLDELGGPDDFLPEAEATALLETGDIVRHTREKRLRRADASVIWVRISIALVRDDEDRPRHMVAHIEDIDEARRGEESRAHAATHDRLTGLPNRALLFDRLNHAVTSLERTGGLIGVVVFDCDRFKVINDQFGHAAGDAVLSELAWRLEQSSRTGDTTARLGGDQFVVLCPGLAEPTEAGDVARRLLDDLNRPVSVGEASVPITCSAGVAVAGGPEADVTLVMRQADDALYQAKAEGRARAVVSREALSLSWLDR